MKYNGHPCVPASFPENTILGSWVTDQRKKYERFQNENTSCVMTKGKIQLLNKVGFEWKLQECVPWDHQYEELVSYMKYNGHPCVPARFSGNPILGCWVRDQRKKYETFQNGNKTCVITKERIRLLNKIGFEWKIQECVLWNH